MKTLRIANCQLPIERRTERFSARSETAEAVRKGPRTSDTQLKLGVNERGGVRPEIGADLRRRLREWRCYGAFTLLELLTVIAIIGILAAIALPTIHSFAPNTAATATRQLLDAVGRARQLAITQRATVYLVFVPTNFWNDPV